MLSIEPELFEEIRKTLFDNYNSQTMTHAGYMIALIIGSLTLMSRWKDLWEFFVKDARSKKHPVVFSFALGPIPTLFLYVLYRIRYWTWIASHILDLMPADLLRSTLKKPSGIAKLQEAVLQDFKTSNFSFLQDPLSWLTQQIHNLDLSTIFIIWALVWLAFSVMIAVIIAIILNRARIRSFLASLFH